MKTIKEKVEEEAENHAPYPDKSEFMVDRSIVFIRQESFKAGADFALKVGIEMLEDRVAMFKRSKDKADNIESQISLGCKIMAINEIINLLKSEV